MDNLCCCSCACGTLTTKRSVATYTSYFSTNYDLFKILQDYVYKSKIHVMGSKKTSTMKQMSFIRSAQLLREEMVRPSMD